MAFSLLVCHVSAMPVFSFQGTGNADFSGDSGYPYDSTIYDVCQAKLVMCTNIWRFSQEDVESWVYVHKYGKNN